MSGVAGGIAAGNSLLSEEVTADHGVFRYVSPYPVAVGEPVTSTVSHTGLCGLAEVLIDWGDQTTTRINTERDSQATHIYRSASTYSVSVESCDDATFCQRDCVTSSTTVTVTDETTESTPPVAGDDAYSTTRKTSLEVQAPGVLFNDSDADGVSLGVNLATEPTNGSITLNADGSFTYTPARGFTGTDSFVYELTGGADTDHAIDSIAVASSSRGDGGKPC